MTDYTWPSIVPATSSWRMAANTAAFGMRPIARMGDRWACTLMLPAMKESTGHSVKAFLTRLRGCAHRVVLPNHAHVRRGTAGNVLVNGSSQSGTTLICDGAGASITNAVRAGDYLTLENRLYMIADDANSDGSGNLVINLTHPLYIAPTNNAAVTLVNPTGRFLFMGESVSWTRTPGDLVQFGPLEFLEDIP